MSGQIKAIQCSVYGMLHHYHGNHILHCIIWHNALGLYAHALCVNAVRDIHLGLIPPNNSFGPFYRLLLNVTLSGCTVM